MWLNGIRKRILIVQSEELTGPDEVLVEVLLGDSRLHIQLLLIYIEGRLWLCIRKSLVLENDGISML